MILPPGGFTPAHLGIDRSDASRSDEFSWLRDPSGSWLSLTEARWAGFHRGLVDDASLRLA